MEPDLRLQIPVCNLYAALPFEERSRLLRGVGPWPRPPSLGFLGDWAGRTSRPSGSPLLGVQPQARRPLSRSGLRANQTWEMRVAGNQGQGPGHNGAIVGLQSVDLQAAVPHPPALLPPIPAPYREVAKTGGLPLGSHPRRGRPGRPVYGLLCPPGGNRAPHC